MAEPVQVSDSNRCKGTGRRFKGSMMGNLPAHCPICKIFAADLGMAGITSAQASTQRVVVPEHSDYRKVKK